MNVIVSIIISIFVVVGWISLAWANDRIDKLADILDGKPVQIIRKYLKAYGISESDIYWLRHEGLIFPVSKVIKSEKALDFKFLLIDASSICEAIYLIFSRLDNEYSFIDYVGARDHHGFGGVLQFNQGGIFFLNRLAGKGTGVYLVESIGYLITENGRVIKTNLRFNSMGYVSGWRTVNREFRCLPVSTATGLEIQCSCSYTNTDDEIMLTTSRTGSVAFTPPNKLIFDQKRLEDLSRFYEDTNANFIEHEFEELRKIAESSDENRIKWLREVLSEIENNNIHKRKLIKILVNKGGAQAK